MTIRIAMRSDVGDAYALDEAVSAWITQTVGAEGVLVELGGGSGTIARRRAGMTIVCVESDPLWVDRLHAAGVFVVQAQIDGPGYSDYAVQRAMTEAADLGTIRVVLIDGPTGTIGRSNVYRAAQAHAIPPGAWIVVDDTHRSEEAAIAILLARALKRERGPQWRDRLGREAVALRPRNAEAREIAEWLDAEFCRVQAGTVLGDALAVVTKALRSGV